MPVEQILPQDQTAIYDTGTVYVIFPEFSDITLACGERHSRDDESVTWCSGAAFQHDIKLGFTHENIDGDHAVNGTLYESPYNKSSFSAFTYADGKFAFEFDNHSEAIRQAAEAGGSGFMQFGLIRDGETVMSINRPRARCYRTLAELNGNLCIIDSVNMLHFEDFMAELHRLGGDQCPVYGYGGRVELFLVPGYCRKGCDAFRAAGSLVPQLGCVQVRHMSRETPGAAAAFPEQGA